MINMEPIEIDTQEVQQEIDGFIDSLYEFRNKFTVISPTDLKSIQLNTELFLAKIKMMNGLSLN